MANLSAEQLEELGALKRVNDALGHRSFIMRNHWRNGYAALVRGGYVRWCDPPPGFDKKRFAGIIILPKGRRALETA